MPKQLSQLSRNVFSGAQRQDGNFPLARPPGNLRRPLLEVAVILCAQAGVGRVELELQVPLCGDEAAGSGQLCIERVVDEDGNDVVVFAQRGDVAYRFRVGSCRVADEADQKIVLGHLRRALERATTRAKS